MKKGMFGIYEFVSGKNFDKLGPYRGLQRSPDGLRRSFVHVQGVSLLQGVKSDVDVDSKCASRSEYFEFIGNT